MRINIHDSFKTWRDFVTTAKTIYRFFSNQNLEIKSMVIYANLVNKTTNKSYTIYRKTNDEKIKQGIDVGCKFNNNDYGSHIILTDEKCLMTQQEYNKLQTKGE